VHPAIIGPLNIAHHTLAGAQPSFESEQAKQPRKRGIDSIKKGEMSPAHRGAALSQSISMQGKSTQEVERAACSSFASWYISDGDALSLGAESTGRHQSDIRL